MLRMTKTLLAIAVVCALMTGAQAASAQNVTTGDLMGVVMDAQKAMLPGATVMAVHVPTGTKYETITQADGRFAILQVRVGGPYTLTASMSGFKSHDVTNVNVALGEARTIEITLALASMQETVNVVAQAQLIDTARAGTASNIDQQSIDSLPTIARSLTDIARIRPMFNQMGSGAGDGASVVSVAGTSFRYNNLQIDGAANNDLFGLASSAGAPGGTAETQPISLDAIAELQMVVSPYDVRQGGFAGGGINAITKSGTNQLHGSGFYFGRNQDWVGDLNPILLTTPTSVAAISTFSDKQYGVSLGGPVMQNKAFFFGTVDFGRKLRPTGYSVSGSGQNFGNEALIDQFLSDLKNLYGYDLGPEAKKEFTRTTNSDKYFGRFDVNLSNNHRLTIRDNYIQSFDDKVGSASTSSYRFPDNFYRYVSNTNSAVAQLNSTWGRGVNELRVTYTRVRDHRENPLKTASSPLFPMVTVTLTTGKSAVAGTERYSSRNAIDQDMIELNEAYTLIKGNHTMTLGSHNEFLKLRNLFIRDNVGVYNFYSLANFEIGRAQGYDRSFPMGSDPEWAARFSVTQLGLYAGDQWRVRNNFSLTYGFRLDAPRFPKKPTANPLAVSTYGYATDVVPNALQWSPRIGFNWNTKTNGDEQIRGGIGMFTGRPAYVWISNQYGSTGMDINRIGANPTSTNMIPFYSDPLAQPAAVTGAGTLGSYTNEIDLIDPNFKFPSILRGNVGWDRKLPFGLVGTAEFLWSKTLKDIKYNNVNLVLNPAAASFGGRIYMKPVLSSISAAPLLQNTREGYNWNVSYELRKPVSKGFFASASYSYGVAKTVMDGTSDQAASNWGYVNTPGSPNNVPLATSNFDPGHRISATAAYEVRIWKDAKATVSAFYSGQSGRPYSLVVYRDINGDGYANDLAYLPASASEMTFTNGTYQQLLDWLSVEPCLSGFLGKVMPRNACRGPWTNTLDARLSVQLPSFKKVKVELTVDALNVLNLINSKNGIVRYMSNAGNTALTPLSFNPSTGVVSTASVSATNPLAGYDLAFMLNPANPRYSFDNLRSRWQIQFGGRIRF